MLAYIVQLMLYLTYKKEKINMSGIKDQVAVLLKTEMDRKDFLKYTAAAGFMAVGAGAIVNSIAGFNKSNAKSKLSQANASMGYGASAYGGRQVAS